MATKSTKKPVKKPEVKRSVEVKTETAVKKNIEVADAPKPQKAEAKRLSGGRYRMTGTYIGTYGVYYAGREYDLDERMANILCRDIMKVN